MSRPEILNESPITMSEVKAELTKIRERDGDLSFRANKAEEYLGQFVTLTPKKIKELHDKIEALNIPRLREQYIIKLIDIMPCTADEVKLVLQSYPTLTVSQDNTKKIAKVLAEYKK